MADLIAIFGILLALGIVFPGLLTACWLLFPATVERARRRLDSTPWRCFWLGVLIALIMLIPITILMSVPVLGVLLVSFTLAFAGLGAAGVAAKMGARFKGHANDSPSSGVAGSKLRTKRCTDA